MDIGQEKKDRFRFLNRLWELSGANEHKWVRMGELGAELGFDNGKTLRMFQFLSGEGLLKMHALNGVIGITHAGIREVEGALSAPAQPTHYFPAVNVISIGTMANSTIQQASPGAHQQADLGQSALQQVQELMSQVKGSLDALQLGAEQRHQVDVEICTIEAQLRSPKPRRTILAECLSSLQSIFEQAAGAIVAAPIIAKISALLAS